MKKHIREVSSKRRVKEEASCHTAGYSGGIRSTRQNLLGFSLMYARSVLERENDKGEINGNI